MSVSVESRGDVAVVTMDDGGHGNPLNLATCRTLAAELRDAATGHRALVLAAGSGPFCAGGDREVLTAWHDWEPPERTRILTDGPQALLRTLLELPVPTVAAVDGVASGAGLDVALACDVRVLGPSARLVSSYVDVGVIPGDGGAWLLPRHVGMGRALEMLLTGRVVGPEEGVRWGLAAATTDEADMLPSAVAFAEALGRKPAGAVAAIRRAALDAAAQDVDTHLRSMGLAMASIAGTRAHAEAVRERLGPR